MAGSWSVARRGDCWRDLHEVVANDLQVRRPQKKHYAPPQQATGDMFDVSAISNEDHVRAKAACAVDDGLTSPPAIDWTAGHRLTSANWEDTSD